MTREEYLQIRHNDISVVYIYYQENLHRAKNQYMLSSIEFLQFFQQLPIAFDIIDWVRRQYDIQFEIMILTNKKGQFIKTL